MQCHSWLKKKSLVIKTKKKKKKEMALDGRIPCEKMCVANATDFARRLDRISNKTDGFIDSDI